MAEGTVVRSQLTNLEQSLLQILNELLKPSTKNKFDKRLSELSDKLAVEIRTAPVHSFSFSKPSLILKLYSRVYSHNVDELEKMVLQLKLSGKQAEPEELKNHGNTVERIVVQESMCFDFVYDIPTLEDPVHFSGAGSLVTSLKQFPFALLHPPVFHDYSLKDNLEQLIGARSQFRCLQYHDYTSGVVPKEDVSQMKDLVKFSPEPCWPTSEVPHLLALEAPRRSTPKVLSTLTPEVPCGSTSKLKSRGSPELPEIEPTLFLDEGESASPMDGFLSPALCDKTAEVSLALLSSRKASNSGHTRRKSRTPRTPRNSPSKRSRTPLKARRQLFAEMETPDQVNLEESASHPSQTPPSGLATASKSGIVPVDGVIDEAPIICGENELVPYAESDDPQDNESNVDEFYQWRRSILESQRELEARGKFSVESTGEQLLTCMRTSGNERHRIEDLCAANEQFEVVRRFVSLIHLCNDNTLRIEEGDVLIGGAPEDES